MYIYVCVCVYIYIYTHLDECLDSLGALHDEPHGWKLAGPVAQYLVKSLVLALQRQRLQPSEGGAQPQVELAPRAHRIRL